MSDDIETRPKDSNADAWHLFLSEYLDARANSPSGMTFMAVQIAEAIDDASALVAEQQRQIEEGEKRIAELEKAVRIRDDRFDEASRDYDAYCGYLGKVTRIEVAELEKTIAKRTQGLIRAENRIVELEKERDRFLYKCAEVRAQKDSLAEHAKIIEERLTALQSFARQMKEALEFYGDRKNYEARIIDGDVKEGIASEDDGAIARAALQPAASLDLGPDCPKLGD